MDPMDCGELKDVMDEIAGEDSSSSFLDLPDRPLIRILRFLDVNALCKVRQTCKKVSKVVTGNQQNLVASEFSSVSVRRYAFEKYVNDRLTFQCLSQIFLCKKEGTTEKILWFQEAIPLDDFDDLVDFGDSLDEMRKRPKDTVYLGIPDSTSLQWMAKTLINTRIRKLKLKDVWFQEDVYNDFVTHWGQQGPAIESISMQNCVHDYDCWMYMIEFLTLSKAKELRFLEDRRIYDTMFCNQFLSLISSLDRFDLCDDGTGMELTWRTEINPSFYQFPPIFVSAPGIMFDIVSFKNAVSEWMANRLKATYWRVILPEIYKNGGQLGATIAIPHKVDFNGTMIFKNAVNQRCKLNQIESALDSLTCTWVFMDINCEESDFA